MLLETDLDTIIWDINALMNYFFAIWLSYFNQLLTTTDQGKEGLGPP